MEERRLLLAVALSFLVLMGYRMLFPPARPRPAAPEVATTTTAPSPTSVPEPPAPVPPTPEPPPAEPAREVAPIADALERRVEVRTPQARIALTNRGASVVSWRLERFLDERGQPQELVLASADGGRPLDLSTGRPDVDRRLREALFQASLPGLEVLEGRPAELRFEFADGDLVAFKQLRFQPDGWQVELTAGVELDGRAIPVRIGWGPGVGNPSAAERAVQGYVAPEAVVLGDGVERLPIKELVDPSSRSGVRWAGVESHYFAALWVPPGPVTADLERAALPTLGEQEPEYGPVAWVPIDATPVLLYVGPKDYHLLDGVGHDLARVVPVGDWIGPLVVPLLALLRWVQGFVGSYGWSIVVLTVLINAAMAPLRHYSIANGLKMAKMAPEMKVIQERYRKVPALDPRRQEMQKEMGALYERHGMSMGTQMAVGCLPIFLTMPFLIAFYRVLTVSIDLRGAEFLWIPDLSHKDPLYLTPILMGVSMILMQRLTPSTMDPSQQRVMMIMPLVLVVMFFAAPAGLNLYWLVANLCSIVQQGITLQVLRSRGEAPVRARREGRRK